MPDLTEDPLRHLIFNWPYAKEFVLDTMDPELIQRHGELLLSRAINIGRIVAFVGAGVSMSYGRISWRELVRAVLDSAEQKYADKAKDPKFTKDNPRIGIIYDTLQALKPNAGHIADEDGAWRDMPSARLLILFQIADELSRALGRINEPDAQARDPAQRTMRSARSVRDEAQQLVYDDAGHARRLLESSYRDQPANQGNGSAVVSQLMGDPDKQSRPRRILERQPSYEQVFTRAALGKLRMRLPAELTGLGRLCDIFVAEGTEGIPPYLNPTHRFIVAAVLAAMPKDKRDEQIEIWAGRPVWADKPPERSYEPRRFREELVDPCRDPLQLLVNRVGIRRFITTNYDIDIERMMLDRGYALRQQTHAGSPGTTFIAESVNAMEARARFRL